MIIYLQINTIHIQNVRTHKRFQIVLRLPININSSSLPNSSPIENEKMM